LFVRSLRNLRTLDVGMNYENIVQFSLDTGSRYDAQQRSDLYKRVLARLEALPGAQSATLLYFSLLGGGGINLNVSVPGYTPAPDENVSCNWLTALVLTKWLEALLFGVRPTDPLTFTVIAVTLALVALLACYIPARRARKIDPMIALRSE
jgi:hypothetical protein